MNAIELLAQAQTYAETAADKAEEYSGVVGSIREMIVQNFGPNGLVAAMIVGASLVLFLVTRLTKVTFSTLKLLVIPALALAVLGSFLFPYSFVTLLPVTATGCSLVLLFKG